MNKNIKKIVRKAPGAQWLNERRKMDPQFKYDKRFFKANYSHSNATQGKIGYNMLLISHALEKGMSNRNPRRFGISKVKELMRLVKQYVAYGNSTEQYDYICAVNVLRSYVEFYEKQGWTDADEYKEVSKFLEKHSGVKKIDVGSRRISKADFQKESAIDYEKFLASRHSVREFLPKRIKQADMKKAVQTAILSPSACNRQMCKVYYVSDKVKSDQIIALAQGFGGFKKETINLLVVTFDVNANYMVGERNQGWFNAGLFSMNLVNALHAIGIGSCFCQFGNSVKDEEMVKKILDIPASERVAVLIAAGYYCDEMLVPYSPRKEIGDIYRAR